MSTKLRVVFNASAAQRGGEVLSNLLDPGPSLLPSIAKFFCWFRKNTVALQADIKKAFFMIAVHEEDWWYLRFV